MDNTNILYGKNGPFAETVLRTEIFPVDTAKLLRMDRLLENIRPMAI